MGTPNIPKIQSCAFLLAMFGVVPHFQRDPHVLGNVTVVFQMFLVTSKWHQVSILVSGEVLKCFGFLMIVNGGKKT